MLYNFIREAEVSGVFIETLKSSKCVPFILGCGLSNKNSSSNSKRSLLRIQRYGYNINYLKRFFCKSVLDKGYISNITGEFISGDSLPEIEDAIFNEEHRLFVEVLDPLFIGNQREVEISRMKNEKFNLDWILHNDTYLELNCKKIISVKSLGSVMNHKDKVEIMNLAVLGINNNNQNYVLYLVNVYWDIFCVYRKESKSLEFKILEEIQLDWLNFNKEQEDNVEMISFDNNQNLIIAQEKYLFQVNSLGKKIERYELPFLFKKIKVLKDDFFINVIGKNGNSILLELKPNELIQTEKENFEKEGIKENSKVLPEIKEMDCEDILSLRSLLKSEFLGTIPIRNANCTSVMLDSKNGHFAKHLWKITPFSPNEARKFAINFDNPTIINNFLMEFYFEHIFSSEKIESLLKNEENDKKQEDKKKGEDKNEDKKENNEEKKGNDENDRIGLPIFSLVDSTTDSSKNQNYIPLRVFNFKGATYNYR